MSANTSPIFPKAPKTGAYKWTTTTTGIQSVFTAGALGAIIQNLSFFQVAASATTVEIDIQKSGVDYRIGRIVTTATANLAVNLLSPDVIPSLNENEPVLALGPNEILRINASNNTAQREVVAIGGDY